MFSRNTAARVLVGIAILVCVGGRASAAPIVIVSQTRTVDADLKFSGSLGSFHGHDGPYTAPDAGPFTAAAQVSAPLFQSFVAASQTSSLDVNATGGLFHGEGAFDVAVFGTPLEAGTIKLESSMDVTFDVIEPQAFTLSAVFVQPWRYVELIGPNGSVVHFEATSSTSGTLTPGRYELLVPYEVPTSQFNSQVSDHLSYSFDLTMTTVPEPGMGMATALGLVALRQRRRVVLRGR